MTPELTVEEGGQGLKVRNLRKAYRKRPVIRDVSLDLNRVRSSRCLDQMVRARPLASIQSLVL